MGQAQTKSRKNSSGLSTGSGGRKPSLQTENIQHEKQERQRRPSLPIPQEFDNHYLTETKKQSWPSTTDIPKKTDQPSKTSAPSITPRIPSRQTDDSGRRYVIALYDYDAASDAAELNFRKNDRLEVLKIEGDWWYAKHPKTGLQGYIPSNFFAEEKTLDCYDWYHGKISRKRAEKDLLAPGNILYTFLVRDSDSDSGQGYALSILSEGDEGAEKTVKHYRIRRLSNNEGFYLTTTSRFSSLLELIQFYQTGQSSEAAKVKLSRACAKAKPPLWDLSKNTRDKWEIPRVELQFGKKVGTGKFGEVHEGLWRNKSVAIKTLKEGSMDPAKFLDEAKIMKQLKHRKLISLYAVCSLQQPFYIITELMSNGCLSDYLKNDQGKRILLPNLIDFAGQVAEGMMYMELKKFVHRDLAARNVLVGDNNQVKIGDFGLSIGNFGPSVNVEKGEKVPVKWTAPEAMRDSQFTTKSDVWSFGILLVELMTYGAIPYPDKTNKETTEFVEKGGRHPCPRLCPEVIYDLMLYCWKKNPSDRPTFESLYGSLEDYAVSPTTGYM